MRLANETGRKTERRTLWIRNRAIVFSYETMVAVFDGTNWFKCDNQWGPTTGRHINEAVPRDAETVSRDRLEDIGYQAVQDACVVPPFRVPTGETE